MIWGSDMKWYSFKTHTHTHMQNTVHISCLQLTQSPVSTLGLHLDLNCSLFHGGPGPCLPSFESRLTACVFPHPSVVWKSDTSPPDHWPPALSGDGGGWSPVPAGSHTGQPCRTPRCPPPATGLSTWMNVLDPDTKPKHFCSPGPLSLKLKFQWTPQAKWCRLQR